MDQGKGRTGRCITISNHKQLWHTQNVERFGVVFRFDPRQEVQTLPPDSAGGFVLSLAKLAMRLVSTRSLTLLDLSHSSYKQLLNFTNLVLWLEEESSTEMALMPSML